MPTKRHQEPARDVEDIRTGYSVAVTLWVHEGSGIWARFSGMVYAHTIVILTLGAILSSASASNDIHKWFCYALCFFGVGLCVLWHFITQRSFVYHDHYIATAKRLEGLLADCRVVNTVAKPPSEFPPTARLRVRRSIQLVIILFVAIYIAAAVTATCITVQHEVRSPAPMTTGTSQKTYAQPTDTSAQHR